MAKIIYLEDTINFLVSKGFIEVVKQLGQMGQFKETQSGYRYILIENKTENNGEHNRNV